MSRPKKHVREAFAWLQSNGFMAPTVVTGTTITDEQIGALLAAAKREKLRATVALCRVALNDCPTYKPAATVNDARARCAELYNRRNA